MKISTSLFSCGVCVAPENWAIHSVPRPYRLYYIRNGSAYFRRGKEEFPLKKNHFYLFPSSLPFLVRQDPDDRLDHMYYDFLMSPPIVSPEPICCSIDDDPLFPAFLSIMESTALSHMNTKTQDSKDTAGSVLDAFLSLMCTYMPVKEMLDSDIMSSVEYIESHYNEPITVSDIAAHLFLNEDYFIQKFKKSIGMTPYAYLSTLRLRIANSLISDGMSISDAATAVGYKYPSSLSHALKKIKDEQ